MALLLPLYLAGALAIGVPIAIHLRNRPQGDVYAFSTLRFLLRSEFRSDRRHSLMRYILLALRVLALAALVLAFAQPWWGTPGPPAEASVVVVIDVSASMRSGSAWEEAKDEAQRVIRDSDGQQAEVAVVSMGSGPGLVRGFDDQDRSAAAAVRNLEPGYGGGDADAALRFAGQLLADRYTKAKRVVVISDMSARTWEPVLWNRPLPPGVEVQPLAVHESPADNLAITDLETPRTFWAADEPIRVVARITLPQAETSGDQISRDPVAVRVRCRTSVGVAEGEESTTQEQVRTVKLRRGGSATVAFDFRPEVLADVTGVIELMDTDDAWRDDDRRQFVIPAGEPIRVGRLAREGADDTFLAAAVEPGRGLAEAPAAGSTFAWVVQDPDHLDLGGLDVLILDQAVSLNEAAKETLAGWIAGGGPVMLMLGSAPTLSDWESNRWPMDIGPTRRAGTTSLQRLGRSMVQVGQRFERVDLRHPVLRPFAQPNSGDLFGIAVERWRPIVAPSLKPLMTMPGGDVVVALGAVEQGRVAVVGFPFDRAWTNWPIDPTFLPFLHETLSWLSERENHTAELRVGQSGPGGHRFDAPGLYTVSQLDGTSQALGPWSAHEAAAQHVGDIERVAVNLDPAESDARRWRLMSSFARLHAPAHAAADLDRAPTRVQAARAGRGTDLTWPLIVAALLLAVGELYFSNRTPR
ncbi:MAG: VWA domain-containing protein [Planctomycetota bacterium]